MKQEEEEEEEEEDRFPKFFLPSYFIQAELRQD